MASNITGVKSMQAQDKTRLLLALWDLGGAEQEVQKGKITRRIVGKGKKIGNYQGIFDDLDKQGLIIISKKGYSLVTPNALEVLGEGLKNPDFKFEGTIIGTWAANALLKWISQMGGAVTVSKASANGTNLDKAIKSYDEFQKVALEVYDRLNSEHNMDNLVPIYRIRREIGKQLSREYFNEWLLEMQADDILQLQGGSVEDSAPDKIEDSVTTELDGLRCYASRLK
ncbi:MAG: hypothetical protein KME64_09015 [Scytonematopsis contorta HA4267-MV1]|jgi:hypothetical protein|nr:hypothetical protein [Scytonematopsis contorta HA4267-MV1]